MNRIDVSVVVTTLNEESCIAACLRSIREQTHPPEKIETIVVDNASTDRTKEIARKYTARVFDRGPERSAQRNLGFEKAGGKYVLYLDADMALRRDTAAECFRQCEEEGLIALTIPERIVGEGFWIKVRDFERGFYDGTCIDAVRFVRRAPALEIGGFDETLTGPEDWDFDRRIREKGRTGIARSALYHDESAFSLKRYVEKKRSYASGFGPYIRKWGRNDKIVRKQLGAPYRLAGVFFEKGKWRRVLAHPLLAAAMVGLKATVGGLCLSGFGGSGTRRP